MININCVGDGDPTSRKRTLFGVGADIIHPNIRIRQPSAAICIVTPSVPLVARQPPHEGACDYKNMCRAACPQAAAKPYRIVGRMISTPTHTIRSPFAQITSLKNIMFMVE